MELIKNKWFMALLAMVFFVGLPACGDDDDDDIKVPDQYAEALKAKFPNATQVSWEREGAYMVAEFQYNGYSTDVWYDGQAKWVMTETDYNRDLNALPTAVVNAFNQSQYAASTIDEIDGYERADATFYVIEVEVAGMGDQDIYINSEGVITKVVDDYGSNVTPTTPIS